MLSDVAQTGTVTEKTYLEDYALGETFVSPARTITETDVVQFASMTGDWHPLHTDTVYARETIFGERIAHGMLTLIVGSTLVLRLGAHLYIPKRFVAFYGLDRVRFTAPVRLGDTIHSINRVVGLTPKDESRGVLEYQSEVRNQRGETVLVWTSKMLVERRPPATGV
jgi:3-hydroxybutyryl-CoA dehydratase